MSNPSSQKKFDLEWSFVERVDELLTGCPGVADEILRNTFWKIALMHRDGKKDSRGQLRGCYASAEKIASYVRERMRTRKRLVDQVGRSVAWLLKQQLIFSHRAPLEFGKGSEYRRFIDCEGCQRWLSARRSSTTTAFSDRPPPQKEPTTTASCVDHHRISDRPPPQIEPTTTALVRRSDNTTSYLSDFSEDHHQPPPEAAAAAGRSVVVLEQVAEEETEQESPPRESPPEPKQPDLAAILRDCGVTRGRAAKISTAVLERDKRVSVASGAVSNCAGAAARDLLAIVAHWRADPRAGLGSLPWRIDAWLSGHLEASDLLRPPSTKDDPDPQKVALMKTWAERERLARELEAARDRQAREQEFARWLEAAAKLSDDEISRRIEGNSAVVRAARAQGLGDELVMAFVAGQLRDEASVQASGNTTEGKP